MPLRAPCLCQQVTWRVSEHVVSTGQQRGCVREAGKARGAPTAAQCKKHFCQAVCDERVVGRWSLLITDGHCAFACSFVFFISVTVVFVCCCSPGAFVQGSPVLSWVSNNTAKLQLQHGAPHSNMQCWTLISTNSYGQVRLVCVIPGRTSLFLRASDEGVHHGGCSGCLELSQRTSVGGACITLPVFFVCCRCHCLLCGGLPARALHALCTLTVRPTRCPRSACLLMWQPR